MPAVFAFKNRIINIALQPVGLACTAREPCRYTIFVLIAEIFLYYHSYFLHAVPQKVTSLSSNCRIIISCYRNPLKLQWTLIRLYWLIWGCRIILFPLIQAQCQEIRSFNEEKPQIKGKFPQETLSYCMRNEMCWLVGIKDNCAPSIILGSFKKVEHKTWSLAYIGNFA